MSINYSIIIPHKNSHILLKRCLDSIPQREDIEIIVIDDHSDDVKAVRETVETKSVARLYDNEGYSAGGARNTGLKYATGKWLLFADCDDYYEKGFLEELDKHINDDIDVLYFNFNQYIEGQTIALDDKISNYIKGCVEGCVSVDFVKFKNNVPWNKMVKRDFVETFNIKFEEQPIANDMFFSFQVGYLCRRHLVVNNYLYNYILYRKSQTNRDWNEEKIKTFLENVSKYNGFVTFVNHKEWTHGLPFICFQLYKYRKLKRIFAVLCYYFSHYFEIRKVREKYPTILKQKEGKLIYKPKHTVSTF